MKKARRGSLAAGDINPQETPLFLQDPPQDLPDEFALASRIPRLDSHERRQGKFPGS